MNKKKSTSILIRVPESLRDELIKEADEHIRTITNYILYLIVTHPEREGKAKHNIPIAGKPLGTKKK